MSRVIRLGWQRFGVSMVNGGCAGIAASLRLPGFGVAAGFHVYNISTDEFGSFITAWFGPKLFTLQRKASRA